MMKLEVKVAQSCLTLCDPMNYTVHGIFRLEYWSRQPFPSSGDLPNPGIEPRSPTLQVDSLPAEPKGKPKNAGVGSLSLLQWIFPTQESNWSLLHCRQILYQLSYQGSVITSIPGLFQSGTIYFGYVAMWQAMVWSKSRKKKKKPFIFISISFLLFSKLWVILAETTH